jgi:hypothetical protein
VKQLDGLFSKALAKHNESSWHGGKKAIVSIIRETGMEKIDLVLKTNCDLLVQSGTYHLMSWLEGKEPNSLQQMVSVIIPQQQSFAPPPPPYSDAGRSESAPTVPVGPVFMVPFQRDPKYLG